MPAVLLVVALSLLSVCCPHGAHAATRHVVILNSFESTPNRLTVADLFRSELERRFSAGVSFTEMDVDARWDLQAREPLLAELLRHREAHLPVDLLFAEGPVAIEFALRHRDSVAPDAPLVATARKGLFERADFRPRDVAIWSDFSFRAAIDHILTVQPAINHVLIVLGSSPLERELARQAQRELAGYEEINFEYTNDLALRELQQRVAGLRRPSAIYLAFFNTDINGAALRGHAALAVARAMSRVPIFGPFEDQLGRGIVGGRLIPLTRNAEMAAEAASDLLQGARRPDPWQVLQLTPPTYDWGELQRSSIDSSLLPPGSEIRYRPRPIWARYPIQTATLAALLIGQALLIAGLLAQRNRALQAERSQTRLAGLLIDAHEVERRRIARELHDDLSQRLAGLAIDAGVLSRAVEDGRLREPLANLESKIGQVTEDVHDLSYRLHPSIVDDLGIVTALHTECERVRQHGDARIVEDIPPLAGTCPRDTALCIYRICQEALANAAHHAGAGAIAVKLSQSRSSLVLEVRDDGCGFDPDTRTSGLGLSSMLERCRLLGGVLLIDSAPGRGTTIRATLPSTQPDSGTEQGAA